MNAFLKMSWVDLKLLFRNWIAVFFTVAFPLLSLFLFGAIYGNEPTPLFGGFGSADIITPGYIAAMTIGTAALMTLPFELTTRRENGVLRRLKASPLHPAVVLLSQLVCNVLLSAASALLLILAGVLVFDAARPHNLFLLALVFLFGNLSLLSLGFLLGSIFRTMNTARAVCMSLFFPMMFISGGSLPLQLLPENVQKVSNLLPVTHLVKLLKGVYLGTGWEAPSFWILVALLVVCTALSFRFFRWE
jgi:ABC-2 type transport system permease protein